MCKVYTFVLQVFAAACTTYASPNIKALIQGLLYNKTANETTGSGDEYGHVFNIFSANVQQFLENRALVEKFFTCHFSLFTFIRTFASK